MLHLTLAKSALIGYMRGVDKKNRRKLLFSPISMV